MLAAILAGCASTSPRGDSEGFLADTAQPRPKAEGESQAMQKLLSKFPQFTHGGVLILAADTAVTLEEAGQDRAGFNPKELFEVYNKGKDEAERLSEKYGVMLPMLRGSIEGEKKDANIAGTLLDSTVTAYAWSTPTGPLGFIPMGTDFSAVGIAAGAALFLLTMIGDSPEVLALRSTAKDPYLYPGWSYEPDTAMRKKLAQYKTCEEQASAAAWLMLERIGRQIETEGFTLVGEPQFGEEYVMYGGDSWPAPTPIVYRLVDNPTVGCPKADPAQDFTEQCRIELLAHRNAVFSDDKDNPTVFGIRTNVRARAFPGFSVPKGSDELRAKAKEINRRLRAAIPAADPAVRVYLPAVRDEAGIWKPQKIREGKTDYAFEVVVKP